MSKILNWKRVLRLQSSCLKLASVVAILCGSHLLAAQITLTIVDRYQSPLVGVTVSNTEQSYHTSSDEKGEVILQSIDVFPVDIQYLGYEQTTLSTSGYEDLDGGVLILREKQNLMEELVLVGRVGTRPEDLPYQIERIDQEKILQNQSQTSADVLTKSGNVFVQKSQMGGGSPIVRGFEANKLLLVVDGVRLNNAIYRSGHLQNAITVDPSMLEQIEIIYGPGSLGYGSDALGGVLHFRSVDPVLNLSSDGAPRLHSHMALRTSSANREKHVHADINMGYEKWAALTSFSFSDFGDLRIGRRGDDRYPGFGLRSEYVRTTEGIDEIIVNDDPYLQIGTGYSQLDLLQKVKYQIDKESYLIGNVQYSASSDIPRYDQLTDRRDGQLRFAEWYYGPQTRFLSSIKYKRDQIRTFYDEMALIAAYQYVEEDRIDRSFASSSRAHQEEDLHIFSTTLDFNKSTRDISWSYGLDMQYNMLQSMAFSEDINTGERSSGELTRYPDGDNSLLYSGAYLSAKKTIYKDRIKLHTGIRYSYNRVSIQYIDDTIIRWPDRYYQKQNSNNTAWTWSVGTQYQIQDDLRLQFLLANAFRSPNIDDISKIRVKGGEITIPNLDLIPERSTSIELNINKDIKATKTKLVASGFYTRLQDAIIRVPYSLPSGDGYIIDELDTLITTANINAAEGYIYGTSLSIQQVLTRHWELKAQYNYTYGRSQLDGGSKAPLAHIPPGFGSVKLRYKKSGFDMESVYSFNQAKNAADFEPSTDNLDQATIDGSPAWSILSLYGNIHVQEWTFSLGLENVFDRHYRGFASGVSGAGRNWIITARYRI